MSFLSKEEEEEAFNELARKYSQLRHGEKPWVKEKK